MCLLEAIPARLVQIVTHYWEFFCFFIVTTKSYRNFCKFSYCGGINNLARLLRLYSECFCHAKDTIRLERKRLEFSYIHFFTPDTLRFLFKKSCEWQNNIKWYETLLRWGLQGARMAGRLLRMVESRETNVSRRLAKIIRYWSASTTSTLLLYATSTILERNLAQVPCVPELNDSSCIYLQKTSRKNLWGNQTG